MNTSSCPAMTGASYMSSKCPASPLFFFMSIVNSILTPKYASKQFCDKDLGSESYDFIVVGGGTAGCALASRLSENPEWSVLLIEAGPEEPLATKMPSLGYIFLGTDIDWKYRTTGERNACLRYNGSCTWPRGKNLGGTSSHNGMMYMRGVPRDFDDWGIPGWSWRDILPYFKYSEDNQEFGNDGYHSTGGPLAIERLPHQPSVIWEILKAAQEAGYPLSDDLNGDQMSGFTVAQSNSREGLRVSSATAFLRPVKHRKNLKVLLNATATKVLTFQRRVTGVRYFKDGRYRTVNARREVILSAGTVGSPHLLLLSGIGPKRHLADKGIPLVTDLPGVGGNLQNHVSFNLSYIINYPHAGFNRDTTYEFIETQTGPLASNALRQLTAKISSKYTSPDYPDLQFFFGGYVTDCSTANREIKTNRLDIQPVYLHPKSRGTIRLATKNPFEHPLITQNYLTEEQDVLGLIEAIKVTLNLTNTVTLAKYNITLINQPIPACVAINKFMSDDYLRCAIRYDTLPENHQTSSCKMGMTGDSNAVVDPRLRVYGIAGLRVADVSVIPKITSGNTAAPAIMIGERAAAFIKEDYTLLA